MARNKSLANSISMKRNSGKSHWWNDMSVEAQKAYKRKYPKTKYKVGKQAFNSPGSRRGIK